MSAPHLRWNAGAWFGSTLGSTLWLLIAALVLVRLDPPLAAFVAALFALANGLCISWWRRRSRLSPAAGLRRAILTFSISTLLAVLAIQLRGRWEDVQISGRASPWVVYAFLALFAPVALVWTLRAERRVDET